MKESLLILKLYCGLCGSLYCLNCAFEFIVWCAFFDHKFLGKTHEKLLKYNFKIKYDLSYQLELHEFRFRDNKRRMK